MHAFLTTGEKIFDLTSATDDNPSCLCGDRKSQLVVFEEHSVSVYDLKDGSAIFSVSCSDDIEFKFPGFATGKAQTVCTALSPLVDETRTTRPLFSYMIYS